MHRAALSPLVLGWMAVFPHGATAQYLGDPTKAGPAIPAGDGRGLPARAPRSEAIGVFAPAASLAFEGATLKEALPEISRKRDSPWFTRDVLPVRDAREPARGPHHRGRGAEDVLLART